MVNMIRHPRMIPTDIGHAHTLYFENTGAWRRGAMCAHFYLLHSVKGTVSILESWREVKEVAKWNSIFTDT
jgi:hypothetical protein